MKRQLRFVAILALVCGASVPAWGANDKAEDLIRRAIEMRRTGDDQGAQPLFREAYEASHSPRAAAQLGFCEQALGRWADAETHLGESLRAANDPWVKKNRPAIEQALVLIKSHIARLEISGEPAGAEVVVNGNVVGQLPLATPVRIAGGEIEVELRAPGYTTTTRRLRVDGGQYQKVLLRAPKEAATAVTTPGTTPADISSAKVVPPTTTAPTAPTAPEPTPPSTTFEDGRTGGAPESAEAGGDKSGTLRKSLKFIGWGLAAGALGVGVYGVVQNRNLVGDFDTGCGNDATGAHVQPDAPPGFTTEKCRSLKSDYESAGRLGVIGLVGAVVFAGAGVVLWLTEPEGAKPQTASWHCLPNVTPRGEPSVGCALRF